MVSFPRDWRCSEVNLSVFNGRAFHCQGIVMQQNLGMWMMCYYCCLSPFHTYFQSAKESLTWNRSQWPMLCITTIFKCQIFSPVRNFTSQDAMLWCGCMNKHVAFTVTVWPKVSSTSTKGCGTCKAIKENHRANDRESTKCRVPPRSCVAIGEHQATRGIDDKTNTKTSDNGGFILLGKPWESTCVAGLQKQKKSKWEIFTQVESSPKWWREKLIEITTKVEFPWFFQCHSCHITWTPLPCTASPTPATTWHSLQWMVGDPHSMSTRPFATWCHSHEGPTSGI